MKKACLLLAMFLVGCNADQSFEVKPYIAEFSLLYHVSTKNIEVDFVETFANHYKIAVCYPRWGLIEVARARWDRLDSVRRRIVIYHELGHCVFHREHLDTLSVTDKCPKSIMASYLMEEDCFQKHYTELINELKPDSF